MKKNKEGKGIGVWRVIILNRVVRESLLGRGTF